MEAHSGDDPVEALRQEFIRLWRRTRADMRQAAREVHPRLEPSGYQLMAILRASEAVPTAELLAELGVEKSTLSRQIAALERLGLVERMADPRDSRARLVTLTSEGLRLFDRQRERNAERWRARFADWPVDDIEHLTELLSRSVRDASHPEE
ncbi:MarR family winged helix-turn-helix transcriptional regulator [Hoyosella altamirensis]|uniref:MarR family winged helix-turn-helix transcriptional regulator n=1 Tax=Hoyosella altamirensis TaxID=616997 RepID=UPI001E40C577|nr:MarR family transcriptional regulator [Hoyosella altamirensis]